MSEPTWELLGGGGTVGGPIDYVGDWAAGVQYQPGQIVRYNGVDYLAVNPSLGQTPPTVPAIGDTAWHFVGVAGEPAFQNGYGNWDGAAGVGRAVRYRKFSNGMVMLAGILKTPSPLAPTLPAFTLPAGYRIHGALGDVSFPINATSAFGLVGVFSSGEVRVNVSNSPASWHYLDGIVFYAEA